MSAYCTYLNGLPMKLRDPETLADPNVEIKTIRDKEYLTLKVTYCEDVGTVT